MEPLAVSINKACSLTGLGRTTIYRLTNDGRLDAVKVGTRSLITMESIKRLMTPSPSTTEEEAA